MKQKVLIANSVHKLNAKIQKSLENGWLPVGSHCVITVHIQNSFRGANHMHAIYTTEYSQTIKK